MQTTTLHWIKAAFMIAATMFAAIAPAKCCSAAEVFASGHGDVGIAFEDGELELELHLEDVGEAFAPHEAVVWVPFTRRETRPTGSAYDGLGVPPGATIYRLSQSAVEAAHDGAPFLGLATEEIPPHTFTTFPGTNPVDGIGLIRLELVAVSGPGHFALWQDVDGLPGFSTRPGLIGMAITSADGISAASDFVELPSGIHDHANWAFTAPGDYTITFRASGELLTGEMLESVAAYNFHVAPEPNALWLAAIGGAIVLCCGVRRAGFVATVAGMRTR
jgi:surface-anchored protein